MCWSAQQLIIYSDVLYASNDDATYSSDVAKFFTLLLLAYLLSSQLPR